MERKETVTIGDVLRECLEKSRMQDRLDEVMACDNFRLVVGDVLADMCRRPSMAKGVMTIRTSNAALRSDLNMRRSQIRGRINDLCGKPTVKDLIFR